MSESSARLVFLFASAGHALFHILTALFLTLVLVLQEVWAEPYDSLVALWTLGALALGLAAPAAGWLSDRFGETRVMIAYFLGIGASVIACGLSDGPVTLQIALFCVGLFGAIYHPVGTAWVVKNVRRRGRSIATLGIAGSIGGAFASLLAGGLADLAGWRIAFILPGALTFAVGLALTWAYASGRVVDRKADLAPQPEPDRRDLRRALIVLLVTMSLTTLVYYAFTTMLPKWIERELGASLGESLTGIGTLVAAIYLIGASAQFVGGHFADRGHAREVYAASYLLKLLALGVATLIGGWAVVPIAVLVVMVFDISAPVENVLIARFTPTLRRGLAFGIRNGIAIIAAPAGIQLVALLFDPERGFHDLLLALAGLVLIIFLAALALPAERPAVRRHPAL